MKNVAYKCHYVCAEYNRRGLRPFCLNLHPCIRKYPGSTTNIFCSTCKHCNLFTLGVCPATIRLPTTRCRGAAPIFGACVHRCRGTYIGPTAATCCSVA